MKTIESPIENVLDPNRWIDDHGDYLFRYAMFRLRNREAAEDAVQESLLAAVQSHDQYERRSSERTWLVGILRHKIVDHLRRNHRYAAMDVESESDFESLCFATQGRFVGHWQPGYAPAINSLSCDLMVEQKDFLLTLEQCLRVLPERLATVFILKEIDGLSCEEICQSLNLSKSNLWVLLHRARLQLRHLLEKEWLGAKASAIPMSKATSMSHNTGSLAAVAGMRWEHKNWIQITL